MLDNFKTLLLRKSVDNKDLEVLIKFMKEEVLADIVYESLEKMARIKSKGDAANFPLRDFATEMDPEHEPNMLHDALSHHASQYKAALKAGEQGVANHHADKIYKLMDMADKAQKHTNGKLSVEAVSPHAWERNSKPDQYNEKHQAAYKAAKDSGKVESGAKLSTDEKKGMLLDAGKRKLGQFVTDTKGWSHRPSDFSFLQQAPHEAYAKEINKHGNNQAYPIEKIKVNGKHLDIQDIPEQALSTEDHPFDKHPIMEHFDEPAKNRTEAKDLQYVKDRDAFHTSPHMDKYFSSQESKEAADPEAFKNMGQKPSAPVHAPVEPLNAKAVLDRKKEKLGG